MHSPRLLSRPSDYQRPVASTFKRDPNTIPITRHSPQEEIDLWETLYQEAYSFHGVTVCLPHGYAQFYGGTKVDHQCSWSGITLTTNTGEFDVSIAAHTQRYYSSQLRSPGKVESFYDALIHDIPPELPEEERLAILKRFQKIIPEIIERASVERAMRYKAKLAREQDPGEEGVVRSTLIAFRKLLDPLPKDGPQTKLF